MKILFKAGCDILESKGMRIKYNPKGGSRTKCWLMIPILLGGWFNFQQRIEHSYAVFKNTSVVDENQIFLYDVLNGLLHYTYLIKIKSCEKNTFHISLAC